VSVRSVIAVLGGLVIISFLSQLLEVPLVRALADASPTNMDEYMTARNHPSMHVAMLIIAALTGLLAGYMVAKIAGGQEMLHAAAAAVLQALLFLRGFAGEQGAAALPAWVHAGVVVVTAGAMLLGAAVRARAARLTPIEEVES
jgi:hypothetical protein